MLTSRPSPPAAYSATITRSDGEVSKIFLEPTRRRIDRLADGVLTEITVSSDEQREIRRYLFTSRECVITPMPSAGKVSAWDPNEGATYTPIAEEVVRGMQCTRFEVRHESGGVEQQWFDEATGLLVQKQTFNKLQQPVLLIEWSDIRVGELDHELFEPIAGFREFRVPAPPGW